MRMEMRMEPRTFRSGEPVTGGRSRSLHPRPSGINARQQEDPHDHGLHQQDDAQRKEDVQRGSARDPAYAIVLGFLDARPCRVRLIETA